jgi:palmitoyl-protein thioesterase
MLLSPLSLIAAAAAMPTSQTASEIARASPALATLVSRAIAKPEQFAHELAQSPLAAIAREMTATGSRLAPTSRNGTMPVVLAHGMGDSCFNSGFKSVTKLVGDRLGVYSVCVPTADNWLLDTIEGFLMSMDGAVDAFAERVRKDPKLAQGFNAIGLSQGNSVIRGYITKYNDPPVKGFMSICGTNAGVGAFPQCTPTTPVIGSICEVLTSVLGDLAYNQLVQSILFQAGYFRDPSKVNTTDYKKFSTLAQWNGEGVASMDLPKARWAKTTQYIWVRGTQDTVVWPNEGEQWGQLADGYPQNITVLPMAQAKWYVEDSFGLKTADLAKKNFFEEFKGEHIRFTSAELEGWLDKYFAE